MHHTIHIEYAPELSNPEKAIREICQRYGVTLPEKPEHEYIQATKELIFKIESNPTNMGTRATLQLLEELASRKDELELTLVLAHYKL